ncbi:hypothetical protein J2847_003356 [Azospirillum agricola]|uniref:sulfotransferase n=1 Tax=Azospirillum agricola TaxID=1720247 RepID=UPI001AE608A9|nr:sulfotransferase [Azospirillum agricola]MBP2230053.1 hypothetical protein [Azospirillum agricola]
MTPSMPSWLRRNAHRIFHPLAGADAATLATVLRDGGGVGPLHLHRVATALGAAAVRAPFDALERRRVERLIGQSPAAPPLFILGHWRSGTTHLLNLLVQDPRLAAPDPLAVGLPWGFLGVLPRDPGALRPRFAAAAPRPVGGDPLRSPCRRPAGDPSSHL